MDVSNLKYYVRRNMDGDIFEKIAVSSIIKITPINMKDHYFINNAELVPYPQVEDSLLNQDVEVPVVPQLYDAHKDKLPKIEFYPIFDSTGLIGKRKVTSISRVNMIYTVVLNNEHMYTIKVLDMDLSSVSEV